MSAGVVSRWEDWSEWSPRSRTGVRSRELIVVERGVRIEVTAFEILPPEPFEDRGEWWEWSVGPEDDDLSMALDSTGCFHAPEVDFKDVRRFCTTLAGALRPLIHRRR